MGWAGLGWAGPVLAQPQGWTQPSRVGWADVPTRLKTGLDSAQPRGLG